MKLQADWLTHFAVQAIFSAYEEEGFQLYAVGGCVRNSLLELSVSDVDLSSNAEPDVAMSFLERRGFRVIPTGLDHGTITVVHQDEQYEITTFRKDVDTDGRHATVKFSTSLRDDARRRDFTINAIYCDRDGNLVDPLSGLDDLVPPTVRFIGSADQRIKEDYLRILRFFRFHANFEDQGSGFDPEVLDACARSLDGIDTLSRERVGSELLRILDVEHPEQSISTMEAIGILGRILPDASARYLGPYVHLEHEYGVQRDKFARLAVLGCVDWKPLLKLSKRDFQKTKTLFDAATSLQDMFEIGYELGSDNGKTAYLIRCAFIECPVDRKELERIEVGARATFPITARDLSFDYEGAALGVKLKDLKRRWLESRATLTRDQLLK